MRLEKFKRPIDRIIAGFSIVVMSILVVCVVWQVFSRYVLNAPSTLTDEIARFCMIWVGLLGAAYTVGAQRHLCIDLFTAHLTGMKKMINKIYINICILIFSSGALIWGGITLVTKASSSGQVSPAMQLPIAYVYAVLPLAGLIMTYYSVLFILEAILELREDNAVNGATLGEKI
ncbi:MAG TPA: TRAP transporter small permease [Psychromonas sp.]